MTPMYGRASPGERVIGRVPRNYGEHSTLLGALRINGLQAAMTVNGSTDADGFRTYVKQVLGPTLVPGDLGVMDNLSAHKATGVQQALARRRVRWSGVCVSSKPPCGLSRRAPGRPSTLASNRPCHRHRA
jgi:hypothetical protein